VARKQGTDWDLGVVMESKTVRLWT